MTSPKEPPPSDAPAGRRFVPRFNTASLLGAMVLVAVICTLAMTMPGLLAAVVGILVTAVLVAYAGVLVAGAMVAQGRTRLFAIAAGVGLAISLWGTPSSAFATYLLDRGGLSSMAALFVWTLIGPLQHIGLSLLGGWIALRATQFWEPESHQPSDEPPPSSTPLSADAPDA